MNPLHMQGCMLSPSNSPRRFQEMGWSVVCTLRILPWNLLVLHGWSCIRPLYRSVGSCEVIDGSFWLAFRGGLEFLEVVERVAGVAVGTWTGYLLCYAVPGELGFWTAVTF